MDDLPELLQEFREGSGDISELLQVFREESGEICDQLALALEGIDGAEEAEALDLIAGAMRLSHNLKGAAATVGHCGVETLAHSIENTLVVLKSEPSCGSAEMIGLNLEAVTTIQQLLDEQDVSNRVTDILARLARITPRLEGGGAVDLQQQNGSKRRAKANGEESVRVPTSRLDRLMSFSGELLISHSRMGARHRRLAELYKRMRARAKQSPELNRALADLVKEAAPLLNQDRNDLHEFRHLTTGLSEAMRRVRMVPLRQLEGVWRRTVREAAQLTGKPVELEIEVGQVELDKHALDHLREPMVHLLRNAVAHGIETAADRDHKDKQRSGRIRIRAALTGPYVDLEVSDDGRGFQAHLVRDKAVQSGALSVQQADELSEQEVIDLVFASGLSTAGQVTTLSGRGVGLEVVREKVRAIGGSVIASASIDLGGASVVMSVPLSLLSSNGLQVQCGETIYALPVESVVRTMRLPARELKRVDGQPVCDIPGEGPVRLVFLSALLGSRANPGTHWSQVVVIARGELRLGLVVDEILGQEEYVTQALPWNLRGATGTHGAMIRADGSVGIALDVPCLFALARQSRVNPDRGGRPVAVSKRILVADDSLTARTLERNMLQSAGFDVEVTVDGKQAWQFLNEQSFDLVVTDVQMPEVDGLELVRRIRSATALRDLPVIVVSRLSSTEDREAAAQAGADEYLVKGTFEQSSLLGLVSKYL